VKNVSFVGADSIRRALLFHGDDFIARVPVVTIPGKGEQVLLRGGEFWFTLG